MLNNCSFRTVKYFKRAHKLQINMFTPAHEKTVQISYIVTGTWVKDLHMFIFLMTRWSSG